MITASTPHDHFGVYQGRLVLVDVLVGDILIGCANDSIAKHVKYLPCKQAF